EDIFIEESEKQISLIFFAVAAAGFLMSFLALNLIQKDQDVNRRLVLSGYHPLELLISNLLALFIMIILIAVYVGLLTNTFFTIAHWGTVVLGLALTGFVYGCYGLLAGSLIRGELEGILLIVLLVNLDAGWLQNPLFYAEAQNQMIIRYLPAYYPSQVTIIAGFTDYSVATACINSLLYGFGLLLLSMLIFFTKMKVHR
ncbi:MAG: ABC transporter permease, partial [Saprospiraceae bacterium]|nr:ABC transporter permease [Saprospiraceae bacterium]